MDQDAYQKEIAEGYKKRVGGFSIQELILALGQLGITSSNENEIVLAEDGNMNATFLDDGFVYKINRDKSEQTYLANKIISDQLGAIAPVVKVVDYDFFEKTDFEILVMEKAEGTLLQRDVFDMSSEEQITLFQQVLKAVKQCSRVTFDEFGDISIPDTTFSTYTEYLLSGLDEHIETIRKLKLCADNDIKKVEDYFRKYSEVFNEDEASLVHNDLHMGNILHIGALLSR